jgi:hypothetical protein
MAAAAIFRSAVGSAKKAVSKLMIDHTVRLRRPTTAMMITTVHWDRGRSRAG